MVKYYSPLVWGIMGVVVGLALIIWQEAVLDIAVFMLGLVVSVTSLIGLISYFSTRGRDPQRRAVILPLTFSLMLVWGILMLFKPRVWVDLSMIMLGVGMAFVAVNQLFGLVHYRRSGYRVTARYYVFPVLLFLAGAMAVWNPTFLAGGIMIFIGCWIGAYGVSEILDYFIFKHSGNDKN